MKRRRRATPQEYSAIRKQVFQRDDYRCVRCCSFGPLHCHHVIYRSQMGDDSVENGVTLCNVCHDEIHRNKALRLSFYDKLRTVGLIHD